MDDVVISRDNKVTTLKKPISIIKNFSNIYKVNALIKVINRRNYYTSERKGLILNLVFFNVYSPLLALRERYKYFLLSINNYS